MMQAESLACERGGRLLFRDLAFTLAPGTLLRVAGPNGSGKTSLLRILCGLARPDAGRLRWRGEDAHALAEDYARELAFVGHLAGIKEDLSAEENLAFALAFAGRAAPAAALREALGQLGLAGFERLPARMLSQGQRRRAALARLALPGPPPLWILDEPFTALDAAAVGAVSAMIVAHLGAGGMAVLTTHQDVELAVATVVHVALAG